MNITGRVESDHDFSTDVNDRYTLLTGAAYHIASRTDSAAGIHIPESDALLAKISSRHAAKGAGGCTEDDDTGLGFDLCHLICFIKYPRFAPAPLHKFKLAGHDIEFRRVLEMLLDRA